MLTVTGVVATVSVHGDIFTLSYENADQKTVSTVSANIKEWKDIKLQEMVIILSQINEPLRDNIDYWTNNSLTYFSRSSDPALYLDNYLMYEGSSFNYGTNAPPYQMAVKKLVEIAINFKGGGGCGFE